MDKITVDNIKDFVRQIEEAIEQTSTESKELHGDLKEYKSLLEVLSSGSDTKYVIDNFERNISYLEGKLNDNLSESERKEIEYKLSRRTKYFKVFQSSNAKEKMKLLISEIEQRLEGLNATYESLNNDLTTCNWVLTDIAKLTVLKNESSMQIIVNGWIETRQKELQELRDKQKLFEENKKLFDGLFQSFEYIKFGIPGTYFGFRGYTEHPYSEIYGDESRKFTSSMYYREQPYYKEFVDVRVELMKFLKKDDNIKKIESSINSFNNDELKELLNQIKKTDITNEEKLRQLVVIYEEEFDNLMVFLNASKYLEKEATTQEVVDEFFCSDIDVSKTLFVNRDNSFGSYSTAGNTWFITIDEIVTFIKNFNQSEIDDSTKQYLIKKHSIDYDKVKEFINGFNIDNLSLQEAYIIYEKLNSLSISGLRLNNNEQIQFHPETKKLFFGEKYKFADVKWKKEHNEYELQYAKERIEKLEKEVVDLSENGVKNFSNFCFSQRALRDDVIPLDSKLRPTILEIDNVVGRYNNLVSRIEHCTQAVQNAEKSNWFSSFKKIVFEGETLNVDSYGRFIKPLEVNRNILSINNLIWQIENNDKNIEHLKQVISQKQQYPIEESEEYLIQKQKETTCLKSIEECEKLKEELEQQKPEENAEYVDAQKEYEQFKQTQDEHLFMKNGKPVKGTIRKFLFRVFNKEYKKNKTEYNSELARLEQQVEQKLQEVRNNIEEQKKYQQGLYKLLANELQIIRNDMERMQQKYAQEMQIYQDGLEKSEKERSEYLNYLGIVNPISKEELKKYFADLNEYVSSINQLQNCENPNEIKTQYVKLLKELLEQRDCKLPEEMINYINELIKNDQVATVNLPTLSMDYYDYIMRKSNQFSNVQDTIIRDRLLAGEVDMSMSQEDAIETIQGRRK